MSIEIVAYEPRFEAAVRSFNQRLRKAPDYEAFTISPSASAPDDRLALQARKRRYLAVDESGEVRGGFLLQRHSSRVAGRDTEVFNLQAPISEGVVDSRYRTIAIQMLRCATRRWPYIYAVGMGGTNQPLPRLLAAMEWRVVEVPFFYRVRRAGRTLIECLRARGWPLPPWIASITAVTGLDGLGRLLFREETSHTALQAEEIDRWAGWANSIWREARDRLGFAVVRTASELEWLYPTSGRILSYRLSEAGKSVAWISLLDSTMSEHRYFGNLRVGTLLDGLALGEYTGQAVRTAWQILSDRGVDLVVTNQLHADWIAAVEENGFRRGPSNYVLALSPELASSEAAGLPTTSMHVTRGDGDGRIHL